MKRLFAMGILLVAAWGVLALFTATPAVAAKGTCANVRCAACSDGYHWLMKWPYCCTCVKN
jgi:hypothetical protein